MDRVFIDVREPFEFRMGHVKGALNIPPSKLVGATKVLQDTAKDAEIVVYCRTGSRSSVAINILKQMGYTNVVNGINKNQVEARYSV